MDSFNVSDRRKAIIKTTWDYLLRTGAVDASIGELCRETKLSQSSLYYWFENKDDIWISAGKYGLSKVINSLFSFTLKQSDDIPKYFDTLLDMVEKNKYELRLAIQITTNPAFGERMRAKAKDFKLLYEKHTDNIMSIFKCTHNQAQVFIYSIIAAIIDYSIWDDVKKTQILLENLYTTIVEKADV